MTRSPQLDPPNPSAETGLGSLLPEGLGGDEVWIDVLTAVDRTYADLVDYQERQNRELEDLRSFLGSTLSSVSDALIVVTRTGTVLETSASVARLTGRDGTALSGPAPVELSVSPRMDDRGRIAGYVLTGRPLGELWQAYSELAETHEALKSAQAQLVRDEKLASLGRLLAGVAHELNNPISFVYANAHALERYAGKFETYFEAVQQGAERSALMRLREELKLDREVRNLRDAVQGAREGAERVRDIVEDLRRLSAEGTGACFCFDLPLAGAR